MNILCISDIHNIYDVFRHILHSCNITHSQTKFDYVFVAGDILERSASSSSHRESVKIWGLIQSALGCPILLTPGNHDPDGVSEYKDIWSNSKYHDIHCLIDESYTLKDGTVVYFTPWSNNFGDWNWMRDESDMNFNIPEDTNIVVSHGPAYGIHDSVPEGTHVGSKKLYNALSELNNLRAVVTGHIHGSGYDDSTVFSFARDSLPVHFIRASVLDDDYCIKDRPLSSLHF